MRYQLLTVAPGATLIPALAPNSTVPTFSRDIRT